MAAEFVHATAIVESDAVGSGTRVWAFAHILSGAHVGNNCNIGDHTFIETGATVGNDVTIKNHVCVWEGITVEDGCFLGPHVVFTNDQYPRSPRMAEASGRYQQSKDWLRTTVVEQGCSIGANATLLPGIRLGRYAMIAAGAVVTGDVPPHTLMMGTPARPVGIVCRCGIKLANKNFDKPCSTCGAILPDSINES